MKKIINIDIYKIIYKMSEFDILKEVLVSCGIGIKFEKGRWNSYMYGWTGNTGSNTSCSSNEMDVEEIKKEKMVKFKRSIAKEIILYFQPSNDEQVERLNNLLVKYCNEYRSFLQRASEKNVRDVDVPVTEGDELYPLVTIRDNCNKVLSEIEKEYLDKYREMRNKLIESYESKVNQHLGTHDRRLQPFFEKRGWYPVNEDAIDDEFGFTSYGYKHITKKVERVSYVPATVYCKEGSVLYDKLLEMGILKEAWETFADKNYRC